MRLEGKVALISGGSRGMGAVEAKLFATEGAKVVIGDILEAEGRKVESDIREAGGDAIFVKLDVTKADDWQRAIDTAVSQFGKLNVLVNNAAIARAETLEETTEEIWDLVMNINAKGVFLGTKLSIPEMRKAGGGSIINVASIAGIIAVGFPAYNASKGAVRLFTKNVAAAHAKYNIRVNSLHPGHVDTPLRRSFAQTGTLETSTAEPWVPMERDGRPEEVAYGALFLASDESSYMTGTELIIDGGVTAT